MIEREFLDDSASRLLNNMKAIETCVAKLTREQIWARHSEKENAIGNLLLHLAGNLRQQVIATLAGEPDVRLRDAEFSARGDQTPEELRALLRSRVEQASEVIRNYPETKLTEQVAPPGRAPSSAFALITHVITHFTGHTYQIIFATKMHTSESVSIFAPAKPAR
ncbi:MAG: DUF1572 family protein [Bryobacteraceae bacterium]